MGEIVAIAIGVGVAAVIVPLVLRSRVPRPPHVGSLAGSIARVVTWSSVDGSAELLSGSGKGGTVHVICGQQTGVGDHVLLVDRVPGPGTVWRVVHLDDADSNR